MSKSKRADRNITIHSQPDAEDLFAVLFSLGECELLHVLSKLEPVLRARREAILADLRWRDLLGELTACKSAGGSDSKVNDK